MEIIDPLASRAAMEPFSFDFSPRLRAMLDSGRAPTRDGGELPIDGASTRNNLQVIRKLVLASRPQNTLEVGLAYGASALAFLASLRDVNEAEFRHVAIDPFQSKDWRGTALHAIAEEGFSEHFEHYEEESCTALARLYREKARFDIIYVDGSHLFEDVFLDFYFAARLLNIGGVILFDDCTDKHVKKVVRFIDANYAMILQRYSLEDFIRKSLLKRMANRLGYSQLVAYSKLAEPPRSWNTPMVGF